MPTLITKTVGSAGGRDFPNWQAAEDFMTLDMVTADEAWRLEGFNDSEFAPTGTILSIAGHTTDVTRNILITTGSGQSFVDHADKDTNPQRYDQSKGVGLSATSFNGVPVFIDDNFVTVEKLQLKVNQTGTAAGIDARNVFLDGIVIRNLIIELGASVGAGQWAIGAAADSGQVVRIHDVTALIRTSNAAHGFQVSGSGRITTTFCTIVRPSGLTVGGSGFSVSSGTLHEARNCAVFGFTDFSSSVNLTGNYNGSDDATNIPGAQSNGTLIYANQFEDNGNTTPDFRAKSTGSLQMGKPDSAVFPSISTGPTATNITAASDPLTVNLPPTLVAGKTLVMLIRCPTAVTFTNPTGWETPLVNGDPGDGSDDVMLLTYKKVVGNEGATVSVDLSAAARAACITWQIGNASDPTVRAPEISTVATGTSTLPDPSNLAPAGDVLDYLWLWLGGWEGEQTSPPAGTPTNYTGAVGADTGTAGGVAGNCRVATASRQLRAASENPGSWTISVSDDWSAWTLAAHPNLLGDVVGHVRSTTTPWVGAWEVQPTAVKLQKRVVPLLPPVPPVLGTVYAA